MEAVSKPACAVHMWWQWSCVRMVQTPLASEGVSFSLVVPSGHPSSCRRLKNLSKSETRPRPFSASCPSKLPMVHRFKTMLYVTP